MVVAIVVSHWKVGFFIFKPSQGWEYCASIAVTAFCLATMGPGEWSLDHAFDIEFTGWTGAIIAGVVGVGGALRAARRELPAQAGRVDGHGAVSTVVEPPTDADEAAHDAAAVGIAGCAGCWSSPARSSPGCGRTCSCSTRPRSTTTST